ncbi:hypothetical protein F4777DRAFT_584090 [Nemania sp. FL0916]|nr:hypothetical protein F4777DRAFT_584090 [Nemania sp. FL0916]
MAGRLRDVGALGTASATAETVDLGPPHAPKEESLRAFAEVESDLKRELLRLRHTYQSKFFHQISKYRVEHLFKHEPEYFALAAELSDPELAGFNLSNSNGGGEDLEAVRVAASAYGIHLFGKVRIPALSDKYLHVRVFVSDEPAKLHCIHTEERDEPGGGKTFRAIFGKDDALEWFDT